MQVNANCKDKAQRCFFCDPALKLNFYTRKRPRLMVSYGWGKLPNAEHGCFLSSFASPK